METVRKYDETDKRFGLFYLRIGGGKEIAPDNTIFIHTPGPMCTAERLKKKMPGAWRERERQTSQ